MFGYYLILERFIYREIFGLDFNERKLQRTSIDSKIYILYISV